MNPVRPGERPSSVCLTHRAYGNAGKWIDFLPAEGHEILIHTSFLTVSNTLTANMRVPACVCLGLCLHICRLMESKRNVLECSCV